jgi:hypothetical protein
MKKIRLILIISAMFFFATSYGQNEKFKALFMYNFTKYIEWPASIHQGDFVIGVLGNSTLTKELDVIAGKQKVGSQNIVVKTFASVDAIENCQIIFIPSGKSALIGAVILKLKGKPTLVITDRNGMALQGAGINFVSDGDKLKYEINKSTIEKEGLFVSKALLSLGIAVF